jgi:DNA-directed RNA polymerase specialized sigma24 family protein
MPIDEKPDGSDSLDQITDSIGIDLHFLDLSDLDKLLGMMSNERYRLLIRFRYVEGRTNEETAGLLGMNMDNYYNKHRLAKKQFRQILKKEKLI